MCREVIHMLPISITTQSLVTRQTPHSLLLQQSMVGVWVATVLALLVVVVVCPLLILCALIGSILIEYCQTSSV